MHLSNALSREMLSKHYFHWPVSVTLTSIRPSSPLSRLRGNYSSLVFLSPSSFLSHSLSLLSQMYWRSVSLSLLSLTLYTFLCSVVNFSNHPLKQSHISHSWLLRLLLLSPFDEGDAVRGLMISLTLCCTEWSGSDGQMAGKRGFGSSQEWVMPSLKLLACSLSPLSARCSQLQSATVHQPELNMTWSEQ